MKLNTEPVALAGAVRAILAVLVAYGLDLSAEQVATVVVAVEVVTALFVRRRVVPTSTITEVNSPEEAMNFLLEQNDDIDWSGLFADEDGE